MSTDPEQIVNGQIMPRTVDVDVTKRNDQLQDSEITPPTESGSVSEDEVAGGGWLGGLGSDLMHLATSIKDTIPPAVGGIATLVHKSAMSVAAEIAQLERDGELDGTEQDWRDDNKSHTEEPADHAPESLHLPWEIKFHLRDASKEQDGDVEDDVPVYMTDEDLMKIILALSQKEDTFLEPYPTHVLENSEVNAEMERKQFVMDEPRIRLIRQLLDIDENLAAMHARLSGRNDIRETAFWRNYFHHCEKARMEYLKPEPNSLHQKENSEQKASVASIPTSPLDAVQSSNPIGSGAATSGIRSAVNNSFISDDSSLVPASLPDDSSYVMTSAPNSLNVFAPPKSMEELVVVEQDSEFIVLGKK